MRQTNQGTARAESQTLRARHTQHLGKEHPCVKPCKQAPGCLVSSKHCTLVRPGFTPLPHRAVLRTVQGMQRMVQSKYAQDTARGVKYAQCKGQCRRMNMAASRRLLEARFSLAPLLKGGTPCWGGGTVQLFGTLRTIPSSWD